MRRIRVMGYYYDRECLGLHQQQLHPPFISFIRTHIFSLSMWDSFGPQALSSEFSESIFPGGLPRRRRARQFSDCFGLAALECRISVILFSIVPGCSSRRRHAPFGCLRAHLEFPVIPESPACASPADSQSRLAFPSAIWEPQGFVRLNEWGAAAIWQRRRRKTSVASAAKSPTHAHRGAATPLRQLSHRCYPQIAASPKSLNSPNRRALQIAEA